MRKSHSTVSFSDQEKAYAKQVLGSGGLNSPTRPRTSGIGGTGAAAAVSPMLPHPSLGSNGKPTGAGEGSVCIPAGEPGSCSYDGATRVFALRGAHSQYAFRIDDHLWLEHLFWGASCGGADDLAYLAQSNTALTFEPVPALPTADAFASSTDELLGAMNLGSHYQRGSYQNLASHCLSGDGNDAEVATGAASAGNPEVFTAAAAALAELRSFKHDADPSSIVDDPAFLAARRENAQWRLRGLGKEYQSALQPTPPRAISPPLASAHGGDHGGVHNDDEDDYSPAGFSAVVPTLAQHNKSPAQHAAPPPAFEHESGLFGGLDCAPTVRQPHFPGTLAELQGGSRAGAFNTRSRPRQRVTRLLDHEHVGRQAKLLEYADFGTGDYRSPSFAVEYQDGSTISPLKYRAHRIVPGSIRMRSGLPQARGDATQCTTLVISSVDELTGLEVELYFTAYAAHDVLVRRTVIRNRGKASLDVTRAMSATVDFGTGNHHMTHLSGCWAAERQVVTQRLHHGTASFGSRRGTSSHQHNPFVAIHPEGPPSETMGECYGMNLIYSGNFVCECEQTETGRMRVNIGVHPLQFTWQLAPGEAFETPEVVLAFSGDGMGGMSRQFHAFYKDLLIPPQWHGLVAPVLVNTWEAMYFDVQHERVMALARAAKATGIEMVVLDDGWFGRERDIDNASLGDWFVNEGKLPRGVCGLVEDINALGLKFGIWIEPEMVNVNSDLYRAHPEWALHHPERERSEGRQQLVLDFTRPEVVEHLTTVLSALFASANIEYVKWDMNRYLSEVYSTATKPGQQGTIYHRQVLGVYQLWHALTSRFPKVLFESCAGGGGRFDPGMLAFSPQAWASDNTDAESRVRIQYGTSICYPMSSHGSHISASPNHQTHRTSTLKTRFLVALSGTFGCEFDMAAMSTEEASELRELIAVRQRYAPLIQNAELFRLWSPFDRSTPTSADRAAWMFVGNEGKEAVVMAFLITKVKQAPLLETADPAALLPFTSLHMHACC